MSDFKAPARKKTIGDYPALKLLAAKIQGSDRQPSLMMYVHPNEKNPSNTEVRIVVFTQTPEQDPKKQKLEVKCTLVDGLAILEAIKYAANAKEKVENIVFQSKVPKDFRNRAAGYREDVKVVVGRNEQGVYITLVSWNAEVPRIRFFFGSTDTFEFVVQSDKGQSFEMFSSFKALGWCTAMSYYLPTQMEKHWKPWVPDNNNQNRGGNGGGWNNNQNSGGGNSTNMDDGLDDVFG